MKAPDDVSDRDQELRALGFDPDPLHEGEFETATIGRLFQHTFTGGGGCEEDPAYRMLRNLAEDLYLYRVAFDTDDDLGSDCAAAVIDRIERRVRVAAEIARRRTALGIQPAPTQQEYYEYPFRWAPTKIFNELLAVFAREFEYEEQIAHRRRKRRDE